MYEKQRHVVQGSNNSHVSPDSNYVLSETTLVMTFPTHTLSYLSSGINLVLIVQLCVIATNSFSCHLQNIRGSMHKQLVFAECPNENSLR